MSQLQENKIRGIVTIATVSVIIFTAAGAGVVADSISQRPETAPAATPKAAAPAIVLVGVEQKAMAIQQRAPVHLVSAAPAPRAAASKPVKPGICPICGSVVSIDVIQHEGEGTGPRTVATVVGISGGAYGSHEIEKHAHSGNTYTYNVAVRMDDGSSHSFDYDAMPAYRAGDKVKVVEGKLVSR